VRMKLGFRASRQIAGPTTVVCACILASLAAFAHDVGREIPAGSTPTHVIARVWSYSFKASTLLETRFAVNLASMTTAPGSHPSSSYSDLRDSRKRADQEAYSRLERRIQEAVETERDPDLVAAIGQIQKAKSWGKSPAAQVLASPDGNRAALVPDFGTPLVVDLRTLRTHRLQNRSDPLQIPMAWSADSRVLAFAPSEARKIVLYDVDLGAVTSTIDSRGAWVCGIALSPDMREIVIMALVNRRLHKSPIGLLAAFSGHPDFRNDLVLQVRSIGKDPVRSVPLESNLTEQSSYDYWIDWQ
jgi:WD40 repeat protein